MSEASTGLVIHDSYSRTKRPFTPLTPGHVGIYVCGPTVYSDTHLGHAKSYVSFDVVVRWLRFSGLRVRHVENITDVGHLVDNADDGEDKLIRTARLTQVHPLELAEKYARLFFKDMDALGVTRPDISPRATGHILEQQAIIRELLARKHAYEVNGSVYFSVASFPEYGRLSGRDTEEGEEGHRVAVRGEKRDPRDFALWKRAEGGHILRWESPWGMGFPGWHIECSAMASRYLGESFDIHGGGLDNQFPHHECEIAQSRAAGHGFAGTWMHNNLVTVEGRKMSKSLGNFTSVTQALEKNEAALVRLWVLSTHYRSPVDYSAQGLEALRGGLERLRAALRAVSASAAAAASVSAAGDGPFLAEVAVAEAAFTAAMNDDFNTPLALGALFDLARVLNTAVARGGLSRAALEAGRARYLALGAEVMGVLDASAVQSVGGDAARYVELLVETRQRLKAAKAFEIADWLRREIASRGVVLEDTASGPRWRFES
jgi:cysteinyl-tRNA synthetase